VGRDGRRPRGDELVRLVREPRGDQRLADEARLRLGPGPEELLQRDAPAEAGIVRDRDAPHAAAAERAHAGVAVGGERGQRVVDGDVVDRPGRRGGGRRQRRQLGRARSVGRAREALIDGHRALVVLAPAHAGRAYRLSAR
jgi:hypothetical protein